MGGTPTGKQAVFHSTVTVQWWLWWLLGMPVPGVPVTLVFPSGAYGPVLTNGVGVAAFSHPVTGLAQVFVNGVLKGVFPAPGSFVAYFP
jgi:hypothetical protein